MNIIKTIKAYLEIKKILKEAKAMAETKEGKRTSEYLLTVLSIVVSIAGVVSGYIPADSGIKIIGALVIVYNIGRVVVKLTPTNVDDKALEKVKELIEKLGGKVPG